MASAEAGWQPGIAETQMRWVPLECQLKAPLALCWAAGQGLEGLYPLCLPS